MKLSRLFESINTDWKEIANIIMQWHSGQRDPLYALGSSLLSDYMHVLKDAGLLFNCMSTLEDIFTEENGYTIEIADPHELEGLSPEMEEIVTAYRAVKDAYEKAKRAEGEVRESIVEHCGCTSEELQKMSEHFGISTKELKKMSPKRVQRLKAQYQKLSSKKATTADGTSETV